MFKNYLNTLNPTTRNLLIVSVIIVCVLFCLPKVHTFVGIGVMIWGLPSFYKGMRYEHSINILGTCKIIVGLVILCLIH